MLHRMQCDIMKLAGEAILALLAGIQSEAELFESAATLHVWSRNCW